MTDSCLFIGWDRPVAGREANAVELFHSITSFFEKRVNQGTVEDFEPCILSSHGGNLNGFFLVRGDENSLQQLRASDEFFELMTKCTFNLEGFGVVNGYTGESVDKVMNTYKKQIT